MADPSVCALMPQASAAIRGGWIAPARRTIKFQYDVPDLRYLPVTYYSRGTYDIDGSFSNVINLVDGIRADSFAASRHYTADDYYVTIPSDDNIESDTREIKLDITKGIMQLNTPRIQGGSGAISATSAMRTDALGVTWIDGAPNVTYLWTSLDTSAVATSRRSLFTVTTRALNTNAAWQFGDSSLGKNWGAAPIMMESCKLGVNFYTDADSLVLRPLDTLGRPTGAVIAATRATSGSWRVSLDLDAEKTPWFGVEQFFAEDSGTVGVRVAPGLEASAGAVVPNPAAAIATIELAIPAGGARVSAAVIDLLGRTVATVPEHRAEAGRPHLELDVRNLPAGAYVCVVNVNGAVFARKMTIGR
jgi:hypothetical protein